MTNKALFLDRDRIINVDHGYTKNYFQENKDRILEVSFIAIKPRGYGTWNRKTMPPFFGAARRKYPWGESLRFQSQLTDIGGTLNAFK